MDLYLHTGGRSKGEYFPDSISGLTRCSRTEIHDDLEYIHASLPFNAAAAQQQQAQEEGADAQAPTEEGAEEAGADGAAVAASARPAKKEKRKMTRAERLEADLEREVAASKRARLQNKIQIERHRLDQTKESGYHLRQSLDALRAETQQYEDAIAQTKREMEMIQRETQILEERLQQSRSEYHWGLDQAERIRIEEEKIETMLREKLSQVNGAVNDVSDRVHQLRQLEEEFKLKDVRIQQLETECSKYETQIQLLDQLITKQISPVNMVPSSSVGLPLPTVMAASAPAIPAPSPTPPSAAMPIIDPNANMQMQMQQQMAPVAPTAAALAPGVDPASVAAAASQPAVDDGAASTAATAPTAPVTQSDDSTAMVDVAATHVAPVAAEVKVEAATAGEPAEPTTAPPTVTNPTTTDDTAQPISSDPSVIGGVVDVPPSVGVVSPPAPLVGVSGAAVSAPMATPQAPAPTLPGIAPLMHIPSGPNPTLSDLLASIHQSTTTIAHLTMTLKLHEEQLESSNRQLIDRDRAMKYMQEQIERFSNLNHELNYKLKQSENLTLEERAKLEQSYKQILFAQKQKDEQATIIGGYEEKLKVFEQLLNVADVRATSAEENVSEMLAELKTTRMSNQILQAGYNRLLKEYERSVREKYASIEEAHQIADTLALSGHATRLNARVDSGDGQPTDVHLAAASPRQLQFNNVKDEPNTAVAIAPRTPSKQAAGDEHAFGFGGINGLASPMDRPDHHGSTSGAFGLHRFEFSASGVPSSHPPLLHASSSISLASPGGPQGQPGLASFISDLPGDGHMHAPNLPPASLAAHYQRFNMLLTAQNRELSLKLNQMTHHNTQLQVALVKLAHRPPKQNTEFIIHATAPTATAPVPPALHIPSSHATSTLKSEHVGSNGRASMDIDSGVSSPLRPSSPAVKAGSASKPTSAATTALQTPKSPLPPLHPKKPVFTEELTL